VPTCSVDERIDAVRARAQEAGWDVSVVINQERIVFGLLRADELATGTEEPIERVMRPGPSTFRPDVPIDEMAAYMVEHDLESSPITSSDGRLIGVLLREDAVRVALELHGHVHDERAAGDR
jgi:Mg/Co/Ni transporter MgtE